MLMLSDHSIATSNPADYFFVDEMIQSQDYILFREPLFIFLCCFWNAQSIDEAIEKILLMRPDIQNKNNAQAYLKACMERLMILGMLNHSEKMYRSSDSLYFLFGFLEVNNSFFSVTIRQLHEVILATSNQEEAAARLNMMLAVFKQLLGRLILYHADKIPYHQPTIQNVYCWLKNECHPNDHEKRFRNNGYHQLIKPDFPILLKKIECDIAIRMEPTLIDTAAHLGLPVVLFEFYFKQVLGYRDFQELKAACGSSDVETFMSNIDIGMQQHGTKRRRSEEVDPLQIANSVARNALFFSHPVAFAQDTNQIALSSNALIGKRLQGVMSNKKTSSDCQHIQSKQRDGTNRMVVASIFKVIREQQLNFYSIYRAIHDTNFVSHAASQLEIHIHELRCLLSILHAMYPLKLPYGVTGVYNTLKRLSQEEAKEFNRPLCFIQLIRYREIESMRTNENRNQANEIRLTPGPVAKAIFYEATLNTASATLCLSPESLESFLVRHFQKKFPEIKAEQSLEEENLRNQYIDFDYSVIVLENQQIADTIATQPSCLELENVLSDNNGSDRDKDQLSPSFLIEDEGQALSPKDVLDFSNFVEPWIDPQASNTKWSNKKSTY